MTRIQLLVIVGFGNYCIAQKLVISKLRKRQNFQIPSCVCKTVIMTDNINAYNKLNVLAIYIN